MITSKLNKSKDFGYSVRAANKRLDKPIDPYPELNKFYVYSNSKKKWYIFKRDLGEKPSMPMEEFCSEDEILYELKAENK